MKFLHAIDNLLLAIVRYIVMFLVEWLGVSHLTVERLFIGLYVIVNVIANIVDYNSKALTLPKTLLFISFVIVCGSVLLQLVRSSDLERQMRLKTTISVSIRVAILIASIAGAITDYALAYHYCRLGSFGLPSYALALTALSLPHNGERGKKRKQALAKLKALLTANWSTASNEA